ncbi:MAG: hypothetical protein MK116_05530 [Phycisphaerales bacterium]|nr:hypothetical protein [Phycisphaerales bacterium]
MTLKAETHRASHFFGWLFLLVALASWCVFFLIDDGQVAEYMWWPALLVGSISSILFGMIFFKGLFD